MRLAVSRTPNARGRINKLIVSMIMRTGIRGVGVPSGRRCARASLVFFPMPMTTVASQNGTAKAMFMESWVVGVKVYGSNPNTLSTNRKNINDVSKSAHLWPSGLIGEKICRANWCTNQDWTSCSRVVKNRLSVGRSMTQGIARAMAIRGMPRRTGLANWLNKFSAMVSFSVAA